MSDLPKGFLRNPVHFCAFGFGSGCAPKAPGTFGFIVGVYFCDKASTALGVHDHGGIVWDEFVGFWITMIAVPEGWQWLILGFFLFRLFDIWKPQPIKYLDEKVHGGFGIMLDDVVAGLFALISLQVIYFLYQYFQ